jgi:hypothetical protein
MNLSNKLYNNNASLTCEDMLQAYAQIHSLLDRIFRGEMWQPMGWVTVILPMKPKHMHGKALPGRLNLRMADYNVATQLILANSKTEYMEIMLLV